MTDRFVWLNKGKLKVYDSNFKYCSTLVALFWVSNEGDVELHNSKFYDIMGLVQSSFLLSI